MNEEIQNTPEEVVREETIDSIDVETNGDAEPLGKSDKDNGEIN